MKSESEHRPRQRSSRCAELGSGSQAGVGSGQREVEELSP